jgi:predicted glutamine amidotransferase
MCRLFGLSAAPQRVRATFWLLDASDSLAAQSRREPDGVGLGIFDADGHPEVYKRPVAAYRDREFARKARDLHAQTFIAHIRFASTGGLLPRNTHPFSQAGRLMAHNGVVEDLPRLEAELGDAMSLVHGDTDSERLFALITRYAERTGDVSRAITEAVGWVADNLPLYAVNIVLTTATELWALRYPEIHDLYVLERASGGPHGDRHLEHASAPGTVRVRCADLATIPAVVVASERMDEDPGWRPLAAGELFHVGPDLTATSEVVLDRAPARQLTLADLHPRAAASQRTSGADRATAAPTAET